ncbi:MAG TPA: RNA polymerase factor sigma-54 [Amaricoccus sp.]|uniref:RNA polymerase factor sigma-54 n=2 Tax=Amaricoccus sp. TaxID=1872485 RepID=UPI002C26ED47|nr:RNA polymerase factor sigma-54 [Amaricoccus sp.]HMR50922.1 RNA polymerase factor sigma-54 [Amaricoccus sp.]HMR58907.1 RNA polymerase factor sigma-54 [Amaricoccus sp.]HMT97899.1 RNA polymerase factor sigma-54 [Amaricoccus sp.]
MALTPRLEIRQSQSLVMTPQMQQAVKLLAMSNLELSEFVAAQAERNPLLEIEQRPPPAIPIRRGAAGGGDTDALLSVAEDISLWQHLHAQIGAMRLSPELADMAALIADELEDDGYLRVPLEEVAQRHRLSSRDAIQALAAVQACEPTGVGARSLQECLALQLRERDRLDPAMQALLANLKLAATGRMAQLESLCGVDAADIADMLAELRGLDPRPGARFQVAPAQIAVPDVFVHRTGSGGLAVELNTETLPRVLVNNVYAAGLAGRNAEARAFVAECRTSASWLVRSLEQRARTILKVATEIVRHQERFFDGGVEQLRPLTQRGVAERVRLHESTVSRVTAGKFLSCSRGSFELRFFFGAALHSLSGGDAFAAAAVQNRIRQIIVAEDRVRTVSDDRIVAILNGEGIDIARRTVAKYREGMGIPSSVQRRRRQASLGGI